MNKSVNRLKGYPSKFALTFLCFYAKIIQMPDLIINMMIFFSLSVQQPSYEEGIAQKIPRKIEVSATKDLPKKTNAQRTKSTETIQNNPKQDTEKRISIHATEGSIRDVLVQVGELANISIITSTKVSQQKITVHFEDTPW